MRTLEIMNSNASSDIQAIVADLLKSRPYTHRQDVDMSVAAVITAQYDLRFLGVTIGAVLAQRVLPAMIVIADCAGRVEQPMQMTFDVIHSSEDVLTEVPEAKTVRVILVGVRDADSFMDAVTQAVNQIDVDAGIRALWTLHDDSRPADGRCLETLLDAWRNNPTASLLGSKQLDWQAENLHNVGLYAGHHDVVSLVVDGEPDQEQYDGRQDVLAVSLSGALVPLSTLRMFGGADPWFGTFAESKDLCRRICLGGGRVVVVPQARIAHRRARFEGIRSRNGRPVEDEDGRIDPYLAIREANAKYAYTDMHRSWWPLLWLWSIIQSLGLAVLCLTRKQPYHACCELAIPWRAILRFPGAWRARARLREQSKVTIKALSTLAANRQQIREWRDRRGAFHDQQGTVLLSPLGKAHLRKRLLRRGGFAIGSALIAAIWIVAMFWDVFRAICSGASMYSPSLLPTDADFTQLAHAATTSWAYASGTGISAPSAPWLLVLMAFSVLSCGHVATAVGLIFFLSAPIMVLSFWALAGVFTRSDAVRCVMALLWFAMALSMDVYAEADVAMLTVMMFLPAAFAFSFRAVGMYRTEDLVKPRASVQSAALAALCFIPVVAAEPQLLLPLLLTFLTFLFLVRAHKPTLLLIPLPSAFVCAPTLVNVARFAKDGTWRQLFGSVMLPSVRRDGNPVIANLSDLLSRVLGIGAGHEWWEYAIVAILGMIVVLAAVSLVLPFVLRASRMMWIAIVTGFATAMLSAAVAVAVDVNGPVAGSMLPGTAYAMLGLLACICMVAGGAVQRFVMLRQKENSNAVEIEGRATKLMPAAARAGRIVLVCLLAVSVVACAVFDYTEHDHGQVRASDSGLPMVSTDFLDQDDARRVLALRADSAGSVSYNVMRTGRGDLIDSSPAQRVEVVAGRSDGDSRTIAQDCAQLLANADSDAIAELGKLGFGGIYVVKQNGSKAQREASSQLSSNIGASDGTQNVVSSDNGTYYRLVIQDLSKQHIDRSGFDKADASPWRRAWLWCMGFVLVAYCLVALPRIRRHGQEEA